MSKIVYNAPWLCHIHDFIGKDAADFMQHLSDVPHTQSGTDSPCERCKAFLPTWTVPFESVNEPVIILCPECQKIPNVRMYIRAKRAAAYPDLTGLDIPNFHSADPNI